MTTRVEQLQGRIHRIKEELLELGEMRPGALSKQYNVCGKSGCRCKAPRNPKKHGPYYQLSYSHKGRSTTEFVRKEMLADVRTHLRNYKKFRALVDKWVELSVRIAKLRREQSKR